MLLDGQTTTAQTVTFFTCIWEESHGGPDVGLDKTAFHGLATLFHKQAVQFMYLLSTASFQYLTN
jgi:hypothetical protein